MKEQMSSFDIAVISVELNSLLRGARVDNFYQINPKTLLLKIRQSDRPADHLLIEAGKRTHLTSYVLAKSAKPSGFCMALRKHLNNGRILEVRQHEFERIILIRVAKARVEYKLIIELFGEGNIILVGPQDEILQALTYRRMRDRNVLPREKFIYPPASGRNPLGVTRDAIEQIKDSGQLNVVRALTSFFGLGGLYAEEILLRARVDKNTLCAHLKKEDMDEIFAQLKQLIQEIVERKAKSCAVIDEQGRWIDVTPTSLQKYAQLNCVTCENLNNALDEYYGKVFAEEQIEASEKRFEQDLEKLKARLRDQENNLDDLRKKVDLNRKTGDIIYAHMNEFQLLLQRLMEEKRSGKSWEEITAKLQEEKKDFHSPAVYFDSVLPKLLALQVSVVDQSFKINLKQSVQQNASECYERAKKAERKLDGLEKAIRQTRRRIEELKTRLIEESKKTAVSPTLRPRKEWYEKFRWFHSSDSFLVIGGKDASTNESLIRKYMKPDDIVFHADSPGAPFVLIKTDGKPPSAQTVKEAAQLAASYSRAWKEMLASTDVYWVSSQQVSERPPSGEYLPRGSFMIYGKRNYLRNVPLLIAIGTKRSDDGLKVIGGPEEAIAKQTDLYVRIVPGKTASSRLAKWILHKLAEVSTVEERQQILKVPIEDIQSFIPSGKGDLLKNR